MLGIDPRAARAAWTVLLISMAAGTVYLIRQTLLIFILALLMAYLLTPLVDLIDRATPKRVPRVISLAVVYGLLVTGFVFAFLAVGSRIAQEASQLAGSVPQWLQGGNPLASLPVPAWLEPWKVRAVEFVKAQLVANASQFVPLVGHIGKGVLSLLSNLGFIILVPILSFFFLRDGQRFREWIAGQFAGASHRLLVQDLLSDVNVLLGQFIRALLILAAATLVFYSLFFTLIGVPYPALLAGLGGALEFIPMIGPLTAGIVIVVVCLLSGQLSVALWVVVFLLGYRLFQDYVLQPYLMSKGVALHPLWVIFGVLAGEQLAGVPGMFLSIPALATLRVIYVRIVKARKSAPHAQ